MVVGPRESAAPSFVTDLSRGGGQPAGSRAGVPRPVRGLNLDIVLVDFLTLLANWGRARDPSALNLAIVAVFLDGETPNSFGFRAGSREVAHIYRWR